MKIRRRSCGLIGFVVLPIFIFFEAYPYLTGTAYKQTCPVGVIFDPQLNTCATPDQSSRLGSSC